MLLIIQESFIVEHQHLRFDLFYCFQNNTYNNDNGCPAEGNICTKNTIKEERDNSNNDQTYSTYENNIIQNSC